MKDIDLAYFAGIIDGEGSITLDRTGVQPGGGRYLQLKLRVGSTDKEVVMELCRVFGGSVCFKIRRMPKYRDTWAWTVGSCTAMECLMKLLPYLRLKRPQAKLGIEFQEAIILRHYKVTDEDRAREESQKALLSDMNRGRCYLE